MIGLFGYAVIGAISWYTFNIARVAWQDGNRFGAIATALLAFVTFAFSALTLLFR